MQHEKESTHRRKCHDGLIFLLLTVTRPGQISVEDPDCEYRSNPLGIDVMVSSLSWKIHSEKEEVILSAFGQEYITPNGRMVSHTQTAYALALSFDLVPDEMKEKAAKQFIL